MFLQPPRGVVVEKVLKAVNKKERAFLKEAIRSSAWMDEWDASAMGLMDLEPWQIVVDEVTDSINDKRLDFAGAEYADITSRETKVTSTVAMYKEIDGASGLPIYHLYRIGPENRSEDVWAE